MVSIDGRRFDRDLSRSLDGIEKLMIKAIRGPFIKTDFAAEVTIGTFMLDDLVDKYDKTTGESSEELFTKYYYLKALVYAFANKKGEGRKYFDKARSRRTGGSTWELVQPHYN